MMSSKLLELGELYKWTGTNSFVPLFDTNWNTAYEFLKTEEIFMVLPKPTNIYCHDHVYCIIYYKNLRFVKFYEDEYHFIKKIT